MKKTGLLVTGCSYVGQSDGMHARSLTRLTVMVMPPMTPTFSVWALIWAGTKYSYNVVIAGGYRC
jgi:hypothetical protein